MPLTQLSLAQSGSYSPGTSDEGKVNLRSLSTAALSHDELDDNFYNLMAKVNECVTQLNTNTTALAENTPWANVTGFPLSISNIGSAGKSLTSVDQLALGVTGAPTAIRIATNGAIELNGYLAPSYPGGDSKFIWKDSAGILRIGEAPVSSSTSSTSSSTTTSESDLSSLQGRISELENTVGQNISTHASGWTSLSIPARVQKWKVEGATTVQQPNSDGYIESSGLNFGAGQAHCFFFVADITAFDETNSLGTDYIINHPAVPAQAKELLVYVRGHETNFSFYDGHEWRWIDTNTYSSFADRVFTIPVFATPKTIPSSMAAPTDANPYFEDGDEVSSNSLIGNLSSSNSTGHLENYTLGNGGQLNTNPISLNVGVCALRCQNIRGDTGAHVMSFCDILAYRL